MATIDEIRDFITDKFCNNESHALAARSEAAMAGTMLYQGSGGVASFALVYAMVRDSFLRDEETRAIMREIDDKLGDGTTGDEG